MFLSFCVHRFFESLPDLEELESKLNAYYALEKDSKRYINITNFLQQSINHLAITSKALLVFVYLLSQFTQEQSN